MVFKEEYLDVQVNGEDGGEFLAMLLNPDNGEVVCQGTGRSLCYVTPVKSVVILTRVRLGLMMCTLVLLV